MSGLPPPIRVLLVDEHTLFRRGVAALLCAESDIAVAGGAPLPAGVYGADRDSGTEKLQEGLMKQINRVGLAILAAGLLCVSLTFGADASAAGKDACAEDIAKFCQNIEPGMSALMDCLEKHENELSGACKEFEATMGGNRVERREQALERTKFRQACANDMAKYCSDATSAQGGMLLCLKDHEREISVSCSESMKMVN
jgi:hypothetical protein